MKKIGFIVGAICFIVIRLGIFFLPTNTQVVAKEVGLIKEMTGNPNSIPSAKEEKSQTPSIQGKVPEIEPIIPEEKKQENPNTISEIYDPIHGCYYDLNAFNQLSKENLMHFKGIGEKTAEAILRYRMEVGLFNSFEELLNIKGIGEKKLASILLNSR